MNLPVSSESMRTLLETCGFEIHDGLEWLEVGVDPLQVDTEFFALDSLTDEQWDGLDAVVQEMCGGWPHSPVNIPSQLSFV